MDDLSRLGNELADLLAPLPPPATSFRVVVIGAGLAGLFAARALRHGGCDVAVVEARPRLGGRVHTDRSLGAPVELGAGWLHGAASHALMKPVLAAAGIETARWRSEQIALLASGGRRLGTVAMLRTAWRGWGQLRAVTGVREDPRATLAALIGNRAGRLGVSEDPLVRLLTGADGTIEIDRISEVTADDFDLLQALDVAPVGGWQPLLDALATGLDITTDCPVTAIRHRDAGVEVLTAAGPRAADAAVLAVPLAVLQAGAVEIDPPLPAPTASAIEGRKTVRVDKIACRFERAWWPRRVSGFIALGDGERASMSVLIPSVDPPILLVSVAGRRASELADADDATVAAAITQSLSSTFGWAVPTPTAIRRAGWVADPFSRGAYSARKQLPIGIAAGPRLWLAGEHVAGEHAATVHGAALSGLRAARQLLAGV